MPANFPTIKTGAVAMNGTSRELEMPTKVHEFTDSTEQRWAMRAPLSRFTLVFTDISGYDLANIRQFVATVKGGFDQTWDITLKGITYSNCSLAEDKITFSEPARKNRFTLTLRVVQGVP